MCSLDEVQKELLFTNLDEDGKHPKQMAKITSEFGIKITNCELGVFGKLRFENSSEKVYNRLKENYMGHKRLECKVLWDEAQKSTLNTVGSTVKNSDIQVTHCQLGIFRERRGNHGSKS